MDNWIKVEDGLPDFDMGVLVCTKAGLVTAAMRIELDSKNFCCDTEVFRAMKGWGWEPFLVVSSENCWLPFDDESVTHWMKLPEPPKCA